MRSRNNFCGGKVISIRYSEPELSLYPWLPSIQSACAVLYCHLSPVWLYEDFPHYLINGTIFGKELLRIKRVSWFSLQLSPETFFILRIIQRNITINLYIGFHVKCPLFLSDFNETWISWTDFRRNSNVKFHENPSSGSHVVQTRKDGRTNRQTWWT